MGTQWKCFREALPMSAHNICFCGEIRKISILFCQKKVSYRERSYHINGLCRFQSVTCACQHITHVHSLCLKCSHLRLLGKILRQFFLFLHKTYVVGIRFINHILFITLLLGSKAKTRIAKQPCYSKTKMYTLYRKITINSHFSL